MTVAQSMTAVDVGLLARVTELGGHRSGIVRALTGRAVLARARVSRRSGAARPRWIGAGCWKTVLSASSDRTGQTDGAPITG